MEIYVPVKRNPLAAYRIGVLDLTLKELAAQNAMSPTNLGMIERGYFHVRRRDRAKYAQIYGLDLATFEQMVKKAKPRQ
jgi:hypothetical protein